MEQLREKNVACFSDNKLSHLSRRKKSLEGEKRNVLFINHFFNNSAEVIKKVFKNSARVKKKDVIGSVFRG